MSQHFYHYTVCFREAFISNAKLSKSHNTVSVPDKFPTCDKCFHNTVQTFDTVIQLPLVITKLNKPQICCYEKNSQM